MKDSRYSTDLMVPDTTIKFKWFIIDKLNSQEEKNTMVKSFLEWDRWYSNHEFIDFIDANMPVFSESTEYITLLANALRTHDRYQLPKLLIHVFDLDMSTAMIIIKAYEERVKDWKKHPRRYTKSSYFKETIDPSSLPTLSIHSKPFQPNKNYLDYGKR